MASRYFSPDDTKPENTPDASHKKIYKQKFDNNSYKGKKRDSSYEFDQNSKLNFPKKISENDPYRDPIVIPKEKIKKYDRGDPVNLKGVKGKFNKDSITQNEEKVFQCVLQSARTELLLSENVGYLEADENEGTCEIEQTEIASAVDITSASKLFSLSLTEFGPYRMDYSRDGRNLLLGGKLGHVAAMDWVTKRLLCEINVMESVHDVCWLHIPTMFATAQKNWVYVYDNKGVELHCIKKLNRVLKMEFLPYHFLLVTSSEKGFLCWLDISVGKMIKETYTKLGRLNVLCQNPSNAVVATGHSNGTVSMWSPNVSAPLVKMLCDPHPITAITIDSKGLYMATASVNRSMKIWDVRTFKCLQSYKLGAASGCLHFSQKELLAVGLGNVVEIYNDCCTMPASTPYLRHKISSTVSDLRFCPYEDVLGIGHGKGFDSILVPGAGEPNFDAYESNPFMTKRQRREMEVKALLEKIQPELITLDPAFLSGINCPSAKEKIEEERSRVFAKAEKLDFSHKQTMQHRSKSAKVFKGKKIAQHHLHTEFYKNVILTKKSTKNYSDNNPKDLLDRFKPKSD